MNENTQLQRIEQPSTMALDAVGRKAAIDDLLNKVALVQEVMAKVMHEGEHYGKIPGCGDKPALLKAGAEKLGMTFRIRPTFQINERDLGRGHREYSIVCTLSDGTQGVGSCSTMESKYRYRGGERTCPKCGKATIIKGKKEYGGGFLCFEKKGGCGAKFNDDDAAITGQQIGKVEHDNPADFYNTCLKMGKKRAHVDAIITATACSDIFTQDVEEFVDQVPKPVTAEPEHRQVEERPRTSAPPEPVTDGGEINAVVTVEMVTERQGTTSKGKPWKAWFCLLNDGSDTKLEAGTFSATIGQTAQSLSVSGDKAQAILKTGKKPGTWEIISLTPELPEVMP